MAALERFLHDERLPYPGLVKAALAHAQFETIDPFLDGNGRLGRLLIAFILHHDGILSRPLLYLSLYFKQHRDEYYRLLDLVRSDGEWETWLDFFLEGVEHTAGNAVETAQRLVALFEDDEGRIQSLGRAASTAFRVFQCFCRRPILTMKEVCRQTGLTFPAVSKAVTRLVRLGIVRELTAQRRNRVFAYDLYLKILSEGTEAL